MSMDGTLSAALGCDLPYVVHQDSIIMSYGDLTGILIGIGLAMMQYDKQRERLEDERSRLLSELAELESRAPSDEERREGSPFGKQVEEAAETFEMERDLALKQRLEAVFAEVEHALGKIAAGTYGRCDACGKEIEAARLEALPQANLCLSCKAKQAKDARSRAR